MIVNKWRNGSKEPSVFGIRWYGFLFLLIWLFYMSFVTLFISFFALIISGILGYYNISLGLLIDLIYSKLRGKNVTSRPHWFLRRYERKLSVHDNHITK